MNRDLPVGWPEDAAEMLENFTCVSTYWARLRQLPC
jgi:hypothetical protein